MENNKIVMLGAGSHTKVLLDCLSHYKDINILGIFDINPELFGKTIYGIPIIGNENHIFKNYSSGLIKLVNGIGSVNVSTLRENIFNKFKKSGYNFFNVFHPNIYLSKDSQIGEGIQLMSGTTIQPGCTIGNNTIVNTHTTVDHDCRIGHHVHLAPGITCCGNVTIGDGTHVGCGTTILQGVKIGKRCLVSAGSVVMRDVLDGSKVAGMPARACPVFR